MTGLRWRIDDVRKVIQQRTHSDDRIDSRVHGRFHEARNESPAAFRVTRRYGYQAGADSMPLSHSGSRGEVEVATLEKGTGLAMNSRELGMPVVTPPASRRNPAYRLVYLLRRHHRRWNASDQSEYDDL